MLQLVLASQSPRRRQLLEEAGFEFAVDPVKVSEIIDENLNPKGIVLDIARQKVRAVASLPKYSNHQGFLILGADTLVFIDNEPLGKPKNIEEAKLFLRRLSGKTHSVMTGVCLFCTDQGLDTRKTAGHTETSLVTFRELSNEEIEDYVASGEPMDKAGAYGLQGRAREFVSRIEGSESNVIGLPVEALINLLDQNGWKIRRK